MNILIGTLLLWLCAATISGGRAEVIEVSVVGDGGRSALYTVDDELTSVRNLAELYLAEIGVKEANNWQEADEDSVRMEDCLGFRFGFDKSLREARVRDGAILRIKYTF